MVKNILSESIVPSIKKNFFNQRIVDFFNKLELSDRKYKTNGTVRDESYKGISLFTIKHFVSFGTNRQSMVLYQPYS